MRASLCISGVNALGCVLSANLVLFSGETVQHHIPMSSVWVTSILTSLSPPFTVCTLFYFSHSEGCAVMSPFGLPFHSLRANDWAPFPMCCLGIHISIVFHEISPHNFYSCADWNMDIFTLTLRAPYIFALCWICACVLFWFWICAFCKRFFLCWSLTFLPFNRGFPSNQSFIHFILLYFIFIYFLIKV